MHAVASDWLFVPATDDAAERRRMRWRANLEAAGVSLVNSRGSYARLAALVVAASWC